MFFGRKYKKSKIKHEQKIYKKLPGYEGTSLNIKKVGLCEKNYDIDTNSSNYKHFSFYDINNLNIYDGQVNIWVDKKDLFKYPKNYDINKIDIFSCLHGYCLVSRSKACYNISLNCFCDLSSNKITLDNCHNFYEGDIVLAKMLHWKKFLPCTILKINDKVSYGSECNVDDLTYFGETTFDVVFPSCPDSKIYLAWHNHNSIIQNNSVLSYAKKTLDVIEECDSSDEECDSSDEDYLNDKLNDNLNPNVIENILDEIINIISTGVNYSGENYSGVNYSGVNYSGVNYSGENYSGVNKEFGNNSPYIFTDVGYIVTGVIDKKVMGKEILKFNTYWIKDNSTSLNKISKKGVTVAATEFSKNLSNNFLQNVGVLENYEMKNILKLQEINGCGAKFFDWNPEYKNTLYNLEPQEYNFFKFSSNHNVIKDYLSRKKGITFTGCLCDSAKKYLFNITNSRF
jgi:hypothetical protein